MGKLFCAFCFIDFILVSRCNLQYPVCTETADHWTWNSGLRNFYCCNILSALTIDIDIDISVITMSMSMSMS